MDDLRLKGIRIPRIIKDLRLGVFHLLNLFFKPIYLRFYQKKINALDSNVQLFFVGRNDFGTQLYLLNYVKVWEEQRGPTCIVILTGDFSRIQQLASIITPNTILIYPNQFSVVFPIILFGTNTIHYFTFHKVYPFLANSRPDGLNLFYLNGNGITEYNSFLDKNFIKHSPQHSADFIKAYKAVRKQFDYRWNLFEDFYETYAAHERPQRKIQSDILAQIGISKPYVILNVNCKDYKDTNSNRRRIHYPERYNVLIDRLLSKGYEVVIQGRGEQPVFMPREGLIDYSKSKCVSVKNDLFLFSNCEFVISSKSGIEIFASICNVPILGLNYTELLGMQPAKKMRFYPKFLRHKATGRILSWREHLESACFFEIGENNYTHNSYEYVDMEEEDMAEALEEFLLLLKGSEKEWLGYTPHQEAFKKSLTPLHLELFLVKGVPSDHYLKKTESHFLRYASQGTALER